MAPGLILYGKAGCPWSLRVRFGFRARGVAYTWVTPDDPRWDPALTITPVLEHAGGRMGESAEILAWVDANAEGAPLPRATSSALEAFEVAVAAARTMEDAPRVVAALARVVPAEGWLDGELPGRHDADAFAIVALATRLGAPLPPPLRAYADRALAFAGDLLPGGQGQAA